MKFSNGYWLMRKGIEAHFARDLFEYERRGDSLRAVAADHPVRSRGAGIGGTVLTIDISSPMKNVIGVRIRHFYGDRPGHRAVETAKEDVTPEIRVEGKNAFFSSGDLSLEITGEDPFRMAFSAGGEELSRSDPKAIGWFRDETTGKRYVRGQLSLSVGESVYGLGERFTPFVKNGQVVDIWQADGGTSSEQAYKNIPFYLTNRGYGVFVASYSDVSFEVGSEDVERVGFSAESECLEYYFIYGKTPRDILERYTALTGRPALPPAWSFGLWLSTSFTTDYDEKTVSSFIDGMAERNIPLSVFHFDCFWMKGNHWVDFAWDREMFPDPAGMLSRLKEKGLRICVWINSYVAQASSLFEEAAEAGYLLHNEDGTVWQTDLWQSGMGIVDFTNPDAVRWYRGHLERLLDMGVDCFKTDFGERIPVKGIRWFDGSDPLEMHNRYTLLYNRTVFETLERKRGRGDAVVFARSATVGSQTMPVHWGGDNSANYPSMAETLRGGLSLACCGFGFWSHDIGGFE
ncbi:MAG: alpha-xylosidase, partial [Clostridia bacterium]|nr:alpha-xylosidase [Clostridia bacterium]